MQVKLLADNQEALASGLQSQHVPRVVLDLQELLYAPE
jgi:hypothetical protein